MIDNKYLGCFVFYNRQFVKLINFVDGIYTDYNNNKFSLSDLEDMRIYNPLYKEIKSDDDFNNLDKKKETIKVELKIIQKEFKF